MQKIEILPRAAGVCSKCDKVMGRERNLQGSSSSHRSAPGAQYVPSGAAGMRKDSARQPSPQGCPGPGMSPSSYYLTVVGLSINFWKYNI